MNWRTVAVVALTLLMAVGCSAGRRNDAYQELLDAEKRYLEDQLYDLHYENGVLLDKYKSTQRENAVLRRRLQDGKGAGAADSDLHGAAPNGAPLDDRIAPPEVELGPPSPDDAPITPPDVLTPERPTPERSFRPAPEGEAPDPLHPEDAAPAGEYPTLHEDLVDPRITHVHLNPLLTGGADFDEKPGDDGVSVVIEPRNAADKYVPVAGPISIVVLDGAREGEAARIARWDFTVNETRELTIDSAFGKGIHLRLPWPAQPPENSRLNLFVRYTTPEGEKLQASREIFIELPGQSSRPWVPMAPASEPLEEIETIEPIGPEIEIHPGAAIPRRTIALNPDSPTSSRPASTPQTSPPPGPTVSEQDARPRWSPYR
jgi:hypothetical protein